MNDERCNSSRGSVVSCKVGPAPILLLDKCLALQLQPAVPVDQASETTKLKDGKRFTWDWWHPKKSVSSRQNTPIPPQIIDEDATPTAQFPDLPWPVEQANALFQNFQAANAICTWNPGLVCAIEALVLLGHVAPHTLLLGGEEGTLERLRAAWTSKILRAPPHYTVALLGEVEGCWLRPISQTRFTPLPDALCLAAWHLQSENTSATLQAIQEVLVRLFPELDPPPQHVLHEALGRLIKDRKLFYTGRGYGVVNCDTYSRTTPAEEDKTPRAMLLSPEEAFTLAHGAVERWTDPQRNIAHASVQTNLLDVICRGSPMDKVLYGRLPSEIVALRNPPARFHRQRSLRLFQGKRSSWTDSRGNSVVGGSLRLSPSKAKKLMEEAAISSQGDEEQYERSKSPHYKERMGFLTRLFRRSVYKKRHALMEFSAQFPPPEWIEPSATVVHLHCIGTQTNPKALQDGQEEDEGVGVDTPPQEVYPSRAHRRSKSHGFHSRNSPSRLSNRPWSPAQSSHNYEVIDRNCPSPSLDSLSLSLSLSPQPSSLEAEDKSRTSSRATTVLQAKRSPHMNSHKLSAVAASQASRVHTQSNGVASHAEPVRKVTYETPAHHYEAFKRNLYSSSLPRRKTTTAHFNSSTPTRGAAGPTGGKTNTLVERVQQQCQVGNVGSPTTSTRSSKSLSFSYSSPSRHSERYYGRSSVSGTPSHGVVGPVNNVNSVNGPSNGSAAFQRSSLQSQSFRLPSASRSQSLLPSPVKKDPKLASNQSLHSPTLVQQVNRENQCSPNNGYIMREKASPSPRALKKQNAQSRDNFFRHSCTGLKNGESGGPLSPNRVEQMQELLRESALNGRGTPLSQYLQSDLGKSKGATTSTTQSCNDAYQETDFSFPMPKTKTNAPSTEVHGKNCQPDGNTTINSRIINISVTKSQSFIRNAETQGSNANPTCKSMLVDSLVLPQLAPNQAPNNCKMETETFRTFPSLTELNINFKSITGQKILQGLSVNSIDTLVEVNMRASNCDLTTRTDLGMV